LEKSSLKEVIETKIPIPNTKYLPNTKDTLPNNAKSNSKLCKRERFKKWVKKYQANAKKEKAEVTVLICEKVKELPWRSTG